MAMNGTITLVSNKGQGSTRKVSVPVGTLASEVFFAELDIADPDQYSIWLNGAICNKPRETALEDGDFVVITPKAVKGGM